MENTKFYKLLLKARYDEPTLIIVIDKIMPLINKYSLNADKEIDDDLRSILIEYAIKLIKNDELINKLAEK